MGEARQAQEERERQEEEIDYDWRMSEWEIEGGFCGCEYPRLWPPRRNE